MLNVELRIFGLEILQLSISTDDEEDEKLPHADSLDSHSAGFVAGKAERDESADVYVRR
jgi:hypothetical protein